MKKATCIILAIVLLMIAAPTVKAAETPATQNPTRAEFLTDLINYISDTGLDLDPLFPEVRLDNPKDISSTNSHSLATVWAYQRGIISGDGRGHIRPDDKILRIEAEAIMVRMLEIISSKQLPALPLPPWELGIESIHGTWHAKLSEHKEDPLPNWAITTRGQFARLLGYSNVRDRLASEYLDNSATYISLLSKIDIPASSLICPKNRTDKWAEVSKEDYTAYAWDGTQLVGVYLVAIGKTGTPSDTGEFKVWTRTDIQTMAGIPGVKYNNFYNGGEAFHTCHWHEDWGMGRSSGCINMREQDAKQMHDHINIGSYVWIH